MSVRATVSSASKCIFASRLSVGPVRTAVRLFSSSNSEAAQHGAPNTPTARASTQERSKPYLPTPFPNTLRTVKKRRSARSKFQDGGNGARTSVSRPPKPSKSPVTAKKEGGRSGSPSTRPPSSRDKIKSHSKKRDEDAVVRSVDSDKRPKSVPVKGAEKAQVVCAFEIPFATETLVGLPPPSQQLPVDTLAHGLDRVLFNQGVHWLQDPRSRVYNFTTWLEKIPKVNDFAFERLSGFVPSSKDYDLTYLSKKEQAQFTGSTSSLSGMLSQIYFLLSDFRNVDLSTLSQRFSEEPADFTWGQKLPATVHLKLVDGVYSIDSSTSPLDDPDKNILTWMGTLLENFLTKPPSGFRQFMREESSPTPPEPLELRPAYRFAKTKSSKLITRSQLDCYDHRLPGTGVFDIKTRACVSIRHDILNFEESSGYLLKTLHGVRESFEKEYYDLIRSAFLKYSFQVRIGGMDGVMVAYHNTDRIFGFQYISLAEMDERLFGPVEGLGDAVFNKCVTILERVLAEAVACFPNQSVKCSFATLPEGVMEVYIQPSKWDGPEDKWPVSKLLVNVMNKLGDKVLPASECMKQENSQWGTTCIISRSSERYSEIRQELEALHLRKRRTLVLPSNVSLDEAEDFWNGLKFGPTTEPKESTFVPEAFTTKETRAIKLHRSLSKQGRLQSEEMERKFSGIPKVVLGQTLDSREA